MSQAFRVALHVDIIGPDKELAQAGECYGSMVRELELPFAPFIGLCIRLRPYIPDDNEQRFSELFERVLHKEGMFDLEQVIYNVDNPKRQFDMRATVSEPTLQRWCALQEYLEFYGFKHFPERQRPLPAV